MARKTITTFLAVVKHENISLVTCDGNDKFQPFKKDLILKIREGYHDISTDRNIIYGVITFKQK